MSDLNWPDHIERLQRLAAPLASDIDSDIEKEQHACIEEAQAYATTLIALERAESAEIRQEFRSEAQDLLAAVTRREAPNDDS